MESNDVRHAAGNTANGADAPCLRMSSYQWPISYVLIFLTLIAADRPTRRCINYLDGYGCCNSSWALSAARARPNGVNSDKTWTLLASDFINLLLLITAIVVILHQNASKLIAKYRPIQYCTGNGLVHTMTINQRVVANHKRVVNHVGTLCHWIHCIVACRFGPSFLKCERGVHLSVTTSHLLSWNCAEMHGRPLQHSPDLLARLSALVLKGRKGKGWKVEGRKGKESVGEMKWYPPLLEQS